MKTKKFWLPCIAAVAIATFVGAKSFKTNAYESNELLLANVEALSTPGDPGAGIGILAPLLRYVWRLGNYLAVTYTIIDGTEKILHEKPVGYAAWVESTYIKGYMYVDGNLIPIMGKKRKCTKFDGKGEPDCFSPGKVELLS